MWFYCPHRPVALKTDCDHQRVGVAAVEDECVGAGLDAVEVELVVHVAHAVGLRIVLVLQLVYVDGLSVSDGADDDAAVHLGGATVDRQVVVRHMQPLAGGIVDHARRVGVVETLGILVGVIQTLGVVGIVTHLHRFFFFPTLESHQ